MTLGNINLPQVLLLIFWNSSTTDQWVKMASQQIVPTIIVHGGAGAVLSSDPEPDDWYQGVKMAVKAGYKALCGDSGSALDAVEAAVCTMEDLPLFNAGRLKTMLKARGALDYPKRWYRYVRPSRLPFPPLLLLFRSPVSAWSSSLDPTLSKNKKFWLLREKFANNLKRSFRTQT